MERCYVLPLVAGIHARVGEEFLGFDVWIGEAFGSTHQGTCRKDVFSSRLKPAQTGKLLRYCPHSVIQE